MTVPLPPGSLFANDYRILKPLSAGGSGTLYVAEQLSTRKLRALKLMQGQLIADESSRRRFEQEARVGARIRSEHVVEVYAAGVDPQSGWPYLATELLEGENLEAVVRRRGALAPAEVRVVMEQVCHAVGAAHQSGIVHRDLKPANVFMARAHRTAVAVTIKVLDFGIAKLLSDQATQTAGIGSPLWLAPEQAGQGQVTPGTDVWALGLLAYFLLTGACFWRSANAVDSAVAQVTKEVLFDPIPAASARAGEQGRALPPGFDSWFARCVNRDPAGRFPDASQAFAQLGPLLPAGGALAQDLALALGPAAELRAAYESGQMTTGAASSALWGGGPPAGAASSALWGGGPATGYVSGASWIGPPTGSASGAIWGSGSPAAADVAASGSMGGAPKSMAAGCLVGAALAGVLALVFGVGTYLVIRQAAPVRTAATSQTPDVSASSSQVPEGPVSASQVPEGPLTAAPRASDVPLTPIPVAGGVSSANLQNGQVAAAGPTATKKTTTLATQNTAPTATVAAKSTPTSTGEKPSRDLAWAIAKAVAQNDIRVCLYSQITRPSNGMFAERHTVTVRFEGTRRLGVYVQGSSTYKPSDLRNGYRNNQPPTQAEVDAELSRILTCIRRKVSGVTIPANQSQGTVVSKFYGPDLADAYAQ